MTDPFGTAAEPSSTTRTPTPTPPASAAPDAPAWTQAPPPAAGPGSTPPPASGWRPRREERGHGASVVFGLIVLAIGLWFFATTTLGLDLPRIEWRQLWPVILIALGAWIVLNSIWRRR